MSQFQNAFIIDALRSPIGRAHKGSLASIRPDDVAAQVVTNLLARVGASGEDIDEIICGCGYPFGEQGYNVARTIGLLAQLPQTLPAQTVSKLCASSLQATRSAAQTLECGEADLMVVCGVESVTRVGRDHHLSDNNALLDPHMPGPTIADLYLPMVQTAENVADQFDISREDMDEYGQQSQDRAVRAQESGFFSRESTPIDLPDGSTVSKDDGPRPSSTMEKLRSLEPVLPGGRVTAGNACPLNDGAAALLVGTAHAAERWGRTPRARIISGGISALEPELMGLGPIGAVRQALKRADLAIEDIDVIEINEAFAAQVIASMQELGLPASSDRVNPHGGAIALGHPFGMTGARLLTTLINGLDECNGRYGLATMCVGGGQGQALVVERLSR